MKPTILYVMDPLCGWCYGFSPVMQLLQQNYKDQFNFRVVPGGMITGARVKAVSVMAEYILGAYTRVEEYSGVKFGEPYLDLLRKGTEISDSEPPCRAIHTFQQLMPERGLGFAHHLQLKQFVDGKSFNEENTYKELALEFGLDAQAFVTTMNSEESRYGTQQEFQWVQAAGITGFPCTIMQKDDKYYMLARGFQDYKGVESVLQRVLADI
ncbi:MAG: DsbA family protein [Sphingobacteriales bacterium]|nr:MAG: DsbA family protein [Sphingobacteriales bacterium]